MKTIMHPEIRFIISFIKLIILCLFLALGKQGIASGFNIFEAAPGLYVHQGVHVNLDDPRRDDIANIGFVVGKRCVAVIDTGGSIAIGQKLKSAIRKVTRLPICYVINTHVHFDHVLGNYAFKSENPRFVGHQHLLRAMEANRNFFAESFAHELASRMAKDKVISPDILVKQKLTLDLGNRKLLITAHPTAHTNQDLTVLDKKTNTLWVSDLIFAERIPSLDGSLKGWEDLTDKLLKLKVERVIPGHGPAPVDWPEAAHDQRRYFHVLLNDIRKIIHQGGFLEDALKTAGQSEKNNWLLFDENHKRNVSRSFTELEWE